MLRCNGIVTTQIMDPQLKSLEYSGDVMIPVFWVYRLRRVAVKINFHPIELNANWYIRLRCFLQGIVSSELSTLVCHSDQAIIISKRIERGLAASTAWLKAFEVRD